MYTELSTSTDDFKLQNTIPNPAIRHSNGHISLGIVAKIGLKIDSNGMRCM